MPDKYDAMSNEELATATLEWEDIPYFWSKDTKGWADGDALGEEGKHVFAAEVKQWMMGLPPDTLGRHWFCSDNWDSRVARLCSGNRTQRCFLWLSTRTWPPTPAPSALRR